MRSGLPAVNNEIRRIARQFDGFMGYHLQTKNNALTGGVFYFKREITTIEKIKLLDELKSVLGVAEIDGRKIGNLLAIWNPKIACNAVLRNNRISFTQI